MKTIATSSVPSRNRNQGLRPTAWWAEHFRRDLQRDWTIPWQAAASLSATLRFRIGASIAEFQRGESSEALNYLAKSDAFSRATNDPAFHRASRFFVAAENAHADLLLRFMQQVGIPVRPKTSCDGVFRWLRGRSDLGWSSRVLLVAELIAQEYYPCLRAATSHPALVRICDRIVSEEAAHVRFQVERIVRVERAQPWIVIAFRDLLVTAVMLGTLCMVYQGHRGVLAPRLSFGTFVGRLWERHTRAIRAMHTLRHPALCSVAPPFPHLKISSPSSWCDSI